MGGLLKIEVRNYLKTKQKYEPSFPLVCPLVEESKKAESMMQRSQRTLTDDELAFFESKDGLMSYVTRFIQALSESFETATISA